MTYYSALNKVFKIFKKAQTYYPFTRVKYRITITHTAFYNPKKLKDHLVRSKVKIRDSNDEKNGVYKCGNIYCDICNVLYLSNKFQSIVTRKRYHINFKFDSNNVKVIFLLTCKSCKKQYVGSTVRTFRLRFNQYNSNIQGYGKEKRGFKQEKLREHFFCPNHSGTHKYICLNN